MKTFKYKLRRNKKFEAGASRVLDVCRELYNASIEERRNAYQNFGVSVNAAMQSKQLPAIKIDRPDVKAVHSQTLQDVLDRSNKAFAAFFRRVKAGEKPGYPRFKSRDRYDSFVMKQNAFRVEGDKLYLPGIGSVRIRLSRPIEGVIRICTIKRDCSGWYVSFACEPVPKPALPPTGEVVGIDMGVKTFATLSDGNKIENPRFQSKTLDELAEAQRQFEPYKTNYQSKKRAKLKGRIRRLHRKVAEQRKDFAHKEANKLIKRYDEIHVEDLKVKQMVDSSSDDKSKLPSSINKTGLRRNIHDAGWSLFLNILIHKAAEAGRKVVKKNPAHTSQTCCQCGDRLTGEAKLSLADRYFDCPKCGNHLDRDLNGAITILQSKEIVAIKVGVKRNRFSKQGVEKTTVGQIVPSGEESPTIAGFAV